MDKSEHAIIGGLIGLLAYVGHKTKNQKPMNPVEVILSTIGGAGAAVLPDLLEPPTNPNHRGIFMA